MVITLYIQLVQLRKLSIQPQRLRSKELGIETQFLKEE
jgi:hypothetical protein